MSIIATEKFMIDVQTDKLYESVQVSSDRLSDFFQFLKTKAACFSLECYYFGKLTKEEYAGIKEEGKRFLDSQYEAYKNNTNGYRDSLEDTFEITTEKEAEKYFKEMRKDYKSNILVEAKRQKGKDPRIDENKLKEIGMSECRMTCNTPSTMGGARMICYFPAEHLDCIVGNMTNLYDYINLDGFEFENLTCYKDGSHSEDSDFYVTTTHESYSSLCIDHKEYEELTDKGILVSCEM